MTSSLRQRRRLETAREIQKAALELATQKRLEDVTTEEIAIAAGVSTRTFFNYYPNKESAAIGHPPKFSEEAKDALRRGEGSLAEDLKQLLDKHIEMLSGDEDILRMVGNILRTNEKARSILDEFLTIERIELTETLSGRVDSQQTSATLAKSATDTIGAAIYLWEHEEDMSLAEAMDAVWASLLDASRLLLSSPS